MHFDESKVFYFDSNFTEFCPQRFNWQKKKKKKNWQKVSICLGNGLMPDKRQAITWTNGDPVQEIILLRIFYYMSGNNIGHPTPPPRPRSSKITKPHQLSLYVFSFDKVTEPHTHLKVHYFSCVVTFGAPLAGTESDGLEPNRSQSPLPGPCLTTVIWRFRNPFSQWQRSFESCAPIG